MSFAISFCLQTVFIVSLHLAAESQRNNPQQAIQSLLSMIYTLTVHKLHFLILARTHFCKTSPFLEVHWRLQSTLQNKTFCSGAVTEHFSWDPLSAQMMYQNVTFQRLCLCLKKQMGYTQVPVMHSGEELVGLFPVGFAECSFGVKRSVSKVWAGD